MFDFLPLPDEFANVLDPNNRLPLEYLPGSWLVLVCLNPKNSEYGFTSAASLHKNWESSKNHHFSAYSSGIPSDAIQVRCPNDSVLAIKISSYSAGEAAQAVRKAKHLPDAQPVRQAPGKLKLRTRK
ncbi:MAG: hypothetical protein M0Q93_00440 [Terrimicrobiaceae bacterium]|nr:hypothetical protein [Terrimicrobiaceae bacterium]